MSAPESEVTALTGTQAARYEQLSMLGGAVPVEEVIVGALDPEPEEVVARDPKQMEWSFTGRGAAALLRSSYSGERYRTAVAVYHALADLANDAVVQRRGTYAEFHAPRKDVAAAAEVHVKSVDRYTKEFEALGLLQVVRPRGGRAHRPNLWRLLQVEGDARRTRGDTRDAANCVGSDTGVASKSVRGDTGVAPVVPGKKEQQEGNKVVPFRRRGEAADPYAIERVVRR